MHSELMATAGCRKVGTGQAIHRMHKNSKLMMSKREIMIDDCDYEEKQ